VGAAVFYAGTSELTTLINDFKVDGDLVDPTEVNLIITSPSGIVTTYLTGDLGNPSVGRWQFNVDVSSEFGEWQYEWVAFGTVTDHTTGTWTVWDTALQHLYAPVQALKSRLGLSDVVDEYELQSACFAASRAIDNICERFFSRVPDTRTFESQGYYKVDLPEYCDLVSITTLKTDATGDGVFETTWDPTDYQLLPQNALGPPEPEPFTRIKAVGTKLFPIPFLALTRTDLIQVTGVFGWPAVPQAIRQATLIAAAELFKMKDAPLGVAGFGDFGVVRVKDNPKVMALVSPYMRHSMLVA
jgi:hypothetical protein